MTTMGSLIFITIMSYIALIGGVLTKRVLSFLLLTTGAGLTILAFYLASTEQWHAISHVTVWIGLLTAVIAGFFSFFED